MTTRLISKARQWAKAIECDVHAVWLAARDPRTPWYAKALALLVAAYALSPIDLIPDFVPVLGLLDDIIILPVGIWLFTRMIPRPLWAEYRAMAEAETKRPVSYMGAALIAGIWLAATALIALMVTSWQYY